MTHARTKLLLAGIVLAGAIAYLAYAGISAGRSYYMEVDAFLADAQYHSRAVRLRGTVSRDNLEINEEDLQVSFQLRGQKHQLPVRYKGALPDMFRAGAEVVVKGRMDSDGVFQAEHLLTKCASKYTDQSHGPDGPETEERK